MTVLNFRKSTVAGGTVTIIQPDYQIRGYTVTIEQRREKDFRVNVGCQSGTVSAKNVENLIFELTGGVHKPQQVKLIVAKGKVGTIKSIRNIPKYLESSEAFLCSSNMKIYPKEEYVLLDHTYTPENETFVKVSGGFNYNGYAFSDEQAKQILNILTILKDYLIPTPVVPCMAPVAAAPAVIEPGTDLPGTEATPAPSVWNPVTA